MTTLRIAVWGMCLSAVLLWFPSGTGAVQSSQLCAGMGDSLWDQWLKGMVPKNDATIDKAQKVKTDCPQLAGSMDRISNDIKGHQQKQASAKGHVKKSGEKYQSSSYDPGGIRTRSGPADN